MKAKKKPLKTIDGMGAEWQTLLKPRLHTLEVNEPKKREGGKKVETVDEVRIMLLRPAPVKCIKTNELS